MASMLSPAEIKMLKMLQANPDLLARVQDPNAFVELKEETRIDRNHRFILSALNASERTNFTNDERDAQDEFVTELSDLLDSLVSMMCDRFKVKSNEKGEAWHALSFLSENGQALNIKIPTTFGHSPNTVWVEETPEEKPVPAAPKRAKK